MLNSPLASAKLLKRLSIRSRLLFAAVIWLSAMILAAGVSVPSQLYHYFVDDAKEQLQLSMDELVANLEVNRLGRIKLTNGLSDPRFSKPYSGLYWTATTKTTLARSRSLWDKTITEDKDHNKRLIGPRGEKLITIEKTLYFPEYGFPIHIIMGADERPIKQVIASVTGQFWVILALLFIGILLLILFQIAWSLSPLTKLQKELAQLKSGDKLTVEGNYPKEVSPLIADLNALLFHYQELLERARNHAGNLSHALKTPLSVLRNEIANVDKKAAEHLTPPVEQIQHHIDYHLGRARMAGSANILSVKSNPSERVDAISLAFDKVYASREITLINEMDLDDYVAVDKTDLDEMLGNLLENAYKWAGNLVVVSSVAEGKNLLITIEDDGPGIPEAQRTEAIKRGVRLDETTPGTGLGLNIVSEMAHSYRGQLMLEESSSKGLKATLSLPLAAN